MSPTMATVEPKAAPACPPVLFHAGEEESIRTAEVQESWVLAYVGAGVAGRAHDEVAVAVAVHVPAAGDGLTEGLVVDGAREGVGLASMPPGSPK